MRLSASVRTYISWLPWQNCMQNRVGDIARHRGAIATRLRIKRTRWTRGEERKRSGEREGNAANRGYARRDRGDFAGATVWNHVATLHNTPVISDRHLTRARSCVLSERENSEKTHASRAAPLSAAANRFYTEISNVTLLHAPATDGTPRTLQLNRERRINCRLRNFTGVETPLTPGDLPS